MRSQLQIKADLGNSSGLDSEGLTFEPVLRLEKVTRTDFPINRHQSTLKRSKIGCSFVREWPDGSLRANSSYKIEHGRFLPSPRFFDNNAARVACSKTSRTPSFVLAEHSR